MNKIRLGRNPLPRTSRLYKVLTIDILYKVSYAFLIELPLNTHNFKSPLEFFDAGGRSKVGKGKLNKE